MASISSYVDMVRFQYKSAVQGAQCLHNKQIRGEELTSEDHELYWRVEQSVKSVKQDLKTHPNILTDKRKQKLETAETQLNQIRQIIPYKTRIRTQQAASYVGQGLWDHKGKIITGLGAAALTYCTGGLAALCGTTCSAGTAAAIVTDAAVSGAVGIGAGYGTEKLYEKRFGFESHEIEDRYIDTEEDSEVEEGDLFEETIRLSSVEDSDASDRSVVTEPIVVESSEVIASRPALDRRDPVYIRLNFNQSNGHERDQTLQRWNISGAQADAAIVLSQIGFFIERTEAPRPLAVNERNMAQVMRMGIDLNLRVNRDREEPSDRLSFQDILSSERVIEAPGGSQEEIRTNRPLLQVQGLQVGESQQVAIDQLQEALQAISDRAERSVGIAVTVPDRRHYMIFIEKDSGDRVSHIYYGSSHRTRGAWIVDYSSIEQAAASITRQLNNLVQEEQTLTLNTVIRPSV